jgi:hypothetical protein
MKQQTITLFILLFAISLMSFLVSCSPNPPVVQAALVAYEPVPVEAKQPEMARFIEDPSLHGYDWDELTQLKFWREIINLPKDTSIVSLASNRKILGKIPTDTWYSLSERQRSVFRNVLRKQFKLEHGEDIYVTHGRNHFYRIEKVLPSIDRAIEHFAKEGVNPWYGQAILLIESPGQMAASHVGAYGAFQLMEGVARQYGLVVNQSQDDREDFGKSASAAAKLIKDMCIPYTKKMLQAQGIPYHENDLFFRCLVLHCYHAGPGNVQAALQKINNQYTGMDLIIRLWNTESAGFKNASQNYSQVALAALLELEDMIHLRYDMICAYGDETLLSDFYIRRYAISDEKGAPEKQLVVNANM